MARIVYRKLTRTCEDNPGPQDWGYERHVFQGANPSWTKITNSQVGEGGDFYFSTFCNSSSETFHTLTRMEGTSFNTIWTKIIYAIEISFILSPDENKLHSLQSDESTLYLVEINSTTGEALKAFRVSFQVFYSKFYCSLVLCQLLSQDFIFWFFITSLRNKFLNGIKYTQKIVQSNIILKTPFRGIKSWYFPNFYHEQLFSFLEFFNMIDYLLIIFTPIWKVRSKLKLTNRNQESGLEIDFNFSKQFMKDLKLNFIRDPFKIN